VEWKLNVERESFSKEVLACDGANRNGSSVRAWSVRNALYPVTGKETTEIPKLGGLVSLSRYRQYALSGRIPISLPITEQTSRQDGKVLWLFPLPKNRLQSSEFRWLLPAAKTSIRGTGIQPSGEGEERAVEGAGTEAGSDSTAFSVG
jgi:hypothetical protein